MSGTERILAAEGPAAPPRANGELVFEAPWQSRIFGLTLALHDAGRFVWSEFQAKLIAAIETHEAELRRADGEGTYDYYGCWLEAFRALAGEKGWLDAAQVDALERELLARPPGHDH